MRITDGATLKAFKSSVVLWQVPVYFNMWVKSNTVAYVAQYVHFYMCTEFDLRCQRYTKTQQ